MNKLLIISILLVVISALVYWYSQETNFPQDGAKGRKVLITGASKGIGEQLAYHYAKHGASVFITGRKEQALKQVVAKCKEIGHKDAVFGYYAADMSDYKQQSKLFVEAGLKFLGGIDSVIVNHVYQGYMLIWQGTTKDLQLFDDMVDVNLKSYVHIVSHALPYIKQSTVGGRIGIVGSILGKNEFQLVSPYSASKFGLDGFFSVLRLELQQSGSPVTVTYSVLGTIATSVLTEWMPTELKRLNISHVASKVRSAGSVVATPQDTAYQVMKGTETGQREIYYPYLYQSRFFKVPACLLSIIRHICPVLVEAMVFPPEFFSNYEKYNPAN